MATLAETDLLRHPYDEVIEAAPQGKVFFSTSLN